MSEPLISLPPLTPESASPEASRMLIGAQEKMGMIPEMYGRMAHSPGLLGAYLDGYQRFRTESAFTPAEQEVVLLAISRFNRCDYCMAAHSWVAEKMSNVPADSLAALRDGKPLPDAKLEALSRFTRAMTDTRGRPGGDEAARFRAAGYSDRHMLDVVLALGVKTISNYSNHLFETPVDAAFAAHVWEPIEAGTLG